MNSEKSLDQSVLNSIVVSLERIRGSVPGVIPFQGQDSDEGKIEEMRDVIIFYYLQAS